MVWAIIGQGLDKGWAKFKKGLGNGLGKGWTKVG